MVSRQTSTLEQTDLKNNQSSGGGALSPLTSLAGEYLLVVVGRLQQCAAEEADRATTV